MACSTGVQREGKVGLKARRPFAQERELEARVVDGGGNGFCLRDRRAQAAPRLVVGHGVWPLRLPAGQLANLAGNRVPSGSAIQCASHPRGPLSPPTTPHPISRT